MLKGASAVPDDTEELFESVPQHEQKIESDSQHLEKDNDNVNVNSKIQHEKSISGDSTLIDRFTHLSE